MCIKNALGSEWPSAPNDVAASKRPQYADAQIGLIERCYRETPSAGHKTILGKYPAIEFSLVGVKSEVSTFKKFGGLGRQAGSGRKRTRRTPDSAGFDKAYIVGNKFATAGEAASEQGVPKTTVRRMISSDLVMDPIRQITKQRAIPRNTTNRLESRKIRGDEIRNGSLDVGEMYFTDERFSRLGACDSGNQNFDVWAKKRLKKHEFRKWPNSEGGWRSEGRSKRNVSPRPKRQS